MNPTKAIAGSAVMFATVLSLVASTPGAQTPAAPAPVAPAPQAGQAPAGPGRGAPAGPGAQAAAPGRGRGNPTATLFADQCAGCHGTDLAGNRAPSLFDQKWLDTVSDARMVQSIENGVPNTEMEPFKQVLNDQQIWALVQYIRTQGANLRTKPAFVPDPNGVVITSEKQKFKIEVVTGGLETPWGLAFLPDGRMLVTERPGRLRVVTNGKLGEPVKGLPRVHVQQDSGMLDVEVDPQYAQNGWIYLAYTENVPGYEPPPPPPPSAEPAPAPPAGGRGRGGAPFPPSMTVFVRGKINANNEWIEQQMLYRPPVELYTNNGAHFGTRFIFDQQGHLFFSIGDRGEFANAQNLSNPLGKIHRINADGTIPKDNPFVGREGAVPSIWAYGHRNPQGFSWDPRSGLLWESEHGPNGGDEINIIEKGHNYGWGVATMGVQNGITKREEPGMDQPIVYYTPTIAPSGITFYTGDRLPAWKHNLFVTGLAGQQLRRLEITDRKVTHQEVVFEQFGRVRDVINSPDGLLYVLIQNPTGAGTGLGLAASTPGSIIRLVPAP